jgi:16S rRNA (cytosine967-C5)-methyltransferase
VGGDGALATPRSEARLAGLPWEALDGVARALDAPLAEVLAGAAAERVLDRLLRRLRLPQARSRRAVAEAIFGVGLWRRRLAWHVGDAPPRVLLASLLRDLAGRPDAEPLCGLAVGALPPPRPAPPSLADRFSLPDWLAGVLAREAGGEAPDLADALSLPGPTALRANRARTDRQALALRLAAEGLPTRPGALAPDALLAPPSPPGLLALPALREGLLEVQDEGSQLVGEALGALPGESVLDACAGAGGKTLQLAAAVGGGGSVHATEPDAARLARLHARARRAGAGAHVEVHGPTAPPGLLVDRALVDAPCSELGTLRRGPDLRFRIDPATFAPLPALQLAILEAAAAHVRPGGRLVYATCTLRREENQEVARAFEARQPGFARRPALPGNPAQDGEGFLRTWPHRHGTDGFFAAAWVRRG